MKKLEFKGNAVANIEKIKLYNPKAFEDLKVQLKKLKKRSFGKSLGDKHGRDLSDCFKIYFGDTKYRIVYTESDDEITILVLAIGERQDLQVYIDSYDEFKKLKAMH